MSRIGNYPVPIPEGVTCNLQGCTLSVAGPKGKLEQDFLPHIGIEIGEGEIVVSRPTDEGKDRAFHGLTRALINNMILGVSQGFERTLVIEGVGYRASLQGTTLNLLLGYSHPVAIDPPEGITFAVEGTQTVKVSGIDKQQVGQVAANVRARRKPEPYKGKGIRYQDERVRRKAGKSGSK